MQAAVVVILRTEQVQEHICDEKAVTFIIFFGTKTENDLERPQFMMGSDQHQCVTVLEKSYDVLC